MKLLFKPSPVLAGIALSVALFSSCTKEGVQNTPVINSTNSFIDNEEMTLMQVSGNLKLIIHPGPNSGQDVYADQWGATGSGNQNHVPELPVNSWDYGGGITTRSFIKFPQLKNVPINARVVSAKLFLYTAENFLNHPQGNTGDNRCAVQRIISHNWREAGLTWDNQPEATTENQAIIQASDQATQQFNYNPIVDVTAMVQQMVAHPETNYGFKLKILNEVPDAAVNFASSEAASPSFRPKLAVTYRY
ncbi:DNRLRE domain-containing protein [Ilyomonas limi]|uniref:DNRLRE domain-containing protein n=1 Tax=Ilyomonas limi TaxID=2575867 RepID=A0A4U3L1Q0_9BACT|nr:DNRLRE domain-containing protein [Ilyomonas limi]TKK68928.1 DNRLRE domain-containing protein [Ilyomonas limi]